MDEKLGINSSYIILLNSSDPLAARHGSYEFSQGAAKDRAGQGFHSLPHLLNRLSRMSGGGELSFAEYFTTPLFRYVLH